VAFGEETVAQMGAEKAGCTGNQDSHAPSLGGAAVRSKTRAEELAGTVPCPIAGRVRSAVTWVVGARKRIGGARCGLV
jgi:hypothetical protein